jgi:hypothetical protein
VQRVGQTIKDEKALLKYRNPFGIAQYINHPPGGWPLTLLSLVQPCALTRLRACLVAPCGPGSQPNVMCFAYEFPNSFPDELKPYIPHEHAKVRRLRGGN